MNSFKPIKTPHFVKRAKDLKIDDVFEIISEDWIQCVVINVMSEEKLIRFKRLDNKEIHIRSFDVLNNWKGFRYVGIYKKAPLWLTYLTFGIVKGKIRKS